ncbi:MAG TPA: 16S rRNA processing protein RimM, partial [Rhodocyclaceae bacterium]|nr:16S rRNA processing protein RimM [Rhodocyclaceae bacterium]
MIVLGRLADPYGVRGWIRLHPYGDDALSWAKMPVWWLGQENGP